MADNKVNSGLLEFSEDQKVFVALDAETSEVKKAVTIDGDGVETDIQGVQPTGKKEITSTAEVNVTSYATAQVVDEDLVASNIKKDVDILGVVGTYEPEAPVSDFSTAVVTVNSSTQIAYSLVLATYDEMGEQGMMVPLVSSYDIGTSKILENVVLYKGRAMCMLEPAGVSTPAVSVSGDIEDVGNNTYIITGNGTITIADSTN